MIELEHFISAVEALVAAVEFDDSGIMVGKERVGGNGGLLSNETINKAAGVRLHLSVLRSALAAVPKGEPQ